LPSTLTLIFSGTDDVQPPERGKVEAHWWDERLYGQPSGPELIDAHDGDAVIAPHDQIPRAFLQDEPERSNGDDGVVGDGDLDPATVVDAPSEAAQFSVWNAVTGPGIRIVQEPRRQAVGLFCECRRDCVQQLVARRARRCAEPQSMGDVWLADEQEASRFVVGQAGQAGLESIDQLDAATSAADGEDRYAGFTECFDITQDRSFRHLESLCELPCRGAAAPLKEQQHVECACRSHITRLVCEHDSRCLV
jgi:hypothetical protein